MLQEADKEANSEEEVEVENEPNPGIDDVGDELISTEAEAKLASRRAINAIMNSLEVEESVMTEAKGNKGAEMLKALRAHMPASVRALYKEEEHEALEEAAGESIIGKDGLKIIKLSNDKYSVDGPWGPFDIPASELSDWVD